jgi:hypothetical protein
MDEMKQQSAKIARGFSRNNSVITVLKRHLENRTVNNSPVFVFLLLLVLELDGL